MKADRELFEEMILDHNRNPFHYMQVPQNTNKQGYGFNPTCGDEFTVHLRAEDGVIKSAGFEGVGCAVSVASTSMMVEAVEGKTLKEADAMFRRMTSFLHGEASSSSEKDQILGKLELLGGILDHPDRIKCANLSWHILHAAIQEDTNPVCTE
ncbi:MAG: SUF system NifU family Fe-S cluster assembly protein [Magnetococcales bacterium]|nr:SUF system NifU family Fe-S cluster assembly protein [Magnetococcales bacterium]MBF0420080.1 SUF system NifU family Fe-S cluster assembly protein [Magnetococcales bacterium]MBF0434837.1 SUF system NifU family Fe-S cluster assembly protein [Magnetococcales bacterium]